jgi:hypothetical protein
LLGAKTKIPKSLSLASALGIVLSFLGLFLPWGTLTWIPGVMGGVFPVFPNQVLGFEVVMGDYALAGCLLGIFAFVLGFSRPNCFIELVFAGEALVAFFSLLWISYSALLKSVWFWNLGLIIFSGPMYWVPMYGAYVSFIGSLITLSAISIHLVTSRKEIT